MDFLIAYATFNFAMLTLLYMTFGIYGTYKLTKHIIKNN